MAANGFSNQVEAYNDWKQGLIDEIGRYREWLSDNGLASEDIQQRLARGCKMLQDDHLTIAFVGEYSRGKTELINALIFAEFGQRMLPSQAGRTTMCPTEIFYDPQRSSNYLRLLPIETRLQNLSIADLKNDPSAWHEIVIDSNDPDQMSFSLQQVAKSRSATIDEAKALGFDVSLLEKVKGHDNEVFIPAWRHALISLDSPLLRQGLRVLDTPGLNALG
ncbi:MAG: dynamin family protein, partial [Oleiphilaceae bacterium]|nr:dynamin family protein [Oleiphilaceae bacterium]